MISRYLLFVPIILISHTSFSLPPALGDSHEPTRGPRSSLFGLDLHKTPLREVLRIAIKNTEGNTWNPAVKIGLYEKLVSIDCKDKSEDLELFSIIYLIWLCQQADLLGINYEETIGSEYLKNPWSSQYNLGKSGVHIWSLLVNMLLENNWLSDNVRSVLEMHLETTQSEFSVRSAFFPHCHDMVFINIQLALDFTARFQSWIARYQQRR